MPVTNRGGLPGADYNYLKAQPPSWESVRTGLSIFALVIIARYCVQAIYRWLRPAQRRDSASLLPTNSPPLRRQHKPHLGPMDDEKSIQGVSDQHEDLRAAAAASTTTTTTIAGSTTGGTTADRHSHWRGAGGALPGPFISRLPPAPPLTPPELSTAVFTWDNEPSPSSQSFIHQPNPDYMSSTSTTAFQTGSPDSASIPRRRSYTRTLPVVSAPGAHSPRAQSPKAESVDPMFLPSSYPPSVGLLLPPAPPSGMDSELDDHRHQTVEVQGEILSVLDRDGAGWTRHTRVYGGGACLACAASGGGFYGATVTPEEMR
ncbi:hypothetical protein J3F83DRAFT_763035 [Trichoderma novae-zelandiae]